MREIRPGAAENDPVKATLGSRLVYPIGQIYQHVVKKLIAVVGAINRDVEIRSFFLEDQSIISHLSLASPVFGSV